MAWYVVLHFDGGLVGYWRSLLWFREGDGENGAGVGVLWVERQRQEEKEKEKR